MTSTIERTGASRTGAPALVLSGVSKTFGCCEAEFPSQISPVVQPHIPYQAEEAVSAPYWLLIEPVFGKGGEYIHPKPDPLIVPCESSMGAIALKG